jgi:transcriptional regulator with XRE-family HTH domain
LTRAVGAHCDYFSLFTNDSCNFSSVAYGSATEKRRGGLDMSPKQPQPIDEHVGARVRKRRRLLGISQELLAQKIGVTFQQVQKYEKGTNRIGASRLQRISEVLGVNAGFFFDHNEDEPVSLVGLSAKIGVDDVGVYLGTKDALVLNRAFTKITDPSLRKHVVFLIEAIAQSREGILQARVLSADGSNLRTSEIAES